MICPQPVHSVRGLQLGRNVHCGMFERRPDKGHKGGQNHQRRERPAKDQITAHVRDLSRGSTAA